MKKGPFCAQTNPLQKQPFSLSSLKNGHRMKEESEIKVWMQTKCNESKEEKEVAQREHQEQP